MNTELIRAQIIALIEAHPEMAHDADLRADMLEGETDLQFIAERLANAVLDAQAMQDAQADRIKALQERKDRYAERERAAKDALFAILEAADLRKVETPSATIAMRAGAQSVALSDISAVPDRYLKTTVALDKVAAKAAMAAGEEVPGVYLTNGSPSVQVRVK